MLWRHLTVWSGSISGQYWRFLSWALIWDRKVLYSNPSAMVLTGRTCFSLFNIARGSRQGCPLSPLPFALLAQTIRMARGITPITVFGTSHYIYFYADDILLYLQVQQIPQPELHIMFHRHSRHLFPYDLGIPRCCKCSPPFPSGPVFFSLFMFPVWVFACVYFTDCGSCLTFW